MKATIVTITGPSCAGKSTLETGLLKAGFGKVISLTTRKMREGEIDGVDYYFVTDEDFELLRNDGQLVESVEFDGNKYAVTVLEVNRLTKMKKPIVVVVEPNGRDQIVKFGSENGYRVIPVFITVPQEIIAHRFVERLHAQLPRAQFSGNVTKLFKTFAGRLAIMMTDEARWINEALAEEIYEIIEENFDEDRYHETIDAICKLAMPTPSYATN